jgi:hypothetical protein
VNPAANIPKVRTRGGPPAQPVQSGANQVRPASSVRWAITTGDLLRDSTTAAPASDRPATDASRAPVVEWPA